jgi:tRNA U38,U39,U40 pseudouridine synthase TruA
VFSCKVHLPRNEDLEEFRVKMNKELPQDVRIFCVLEVSNSFNAKLRTSTREYSYYLPTFLLQSINEMFLGTPPHLQTKPDHPHSTQLTQNEELKESEPKPAHTGIKIMRSQPT